MTDTTLSRRTIPEGTTSITELLDELDGRLTYRILDYWIREGAITLSHPGTGSGSRRCVTPAERRAIIDMVETYERAQRDLANLRSGTLFGQLLAWHDYDARRQAS